MCEKEEHHTIFASYSDSLRRRKLSLHPLHVHLSRYKLSPFHSDHNGPPQLVARVPYCLARSRVNAKMPVRRYGNEAHLRRTRVALVSKR